jgi:hypothetical protein
MTKKQRKQSPLPTEPCSVDATLTSAKLAPRLNAPEVAAAVVVDTAAEVAVAADEAPVVAAVVADTAAVVAVDAAAVVADATNFHASDLRKASALSLAFLVLPFLFSCSLISMSSRGGL